MAMKRCPVCGERYSDTYKNCPFCEEEEYWEEEQDSRRPILREGARGSSHRSAYGIVTPILIVLIVLMAALLIYLLYGDKLKPSKDPDDNKPSVTEPKEPDTTPGTTPAQDPATTDPEGSGDGSDGTTEPNTPDDGAMPEGSGNASGNTGTPSGGGTTSGGMSYASAAALPSGLTLSSTDFTEPASTGTVKLRVSGGTGSYTWISENPAIATVASDGTVTLVAKGTTNVVVTDGTKKAICIVRVSSGPSPTGSGGTTSSGTTSSGTTSNGTSSGGTTSSGTASGGTTSSGGSLKAGKAVVINGGNGVRVRSGPSTNHEILATIPNGGSVQIVSSAGDGWYQITFSNVGGVTTTGYMKGEFLANA